MRRPGYNNREEGERHRPEPVPEAGLRRHWPDDVDVGNVGVLPDDRGIVQRRRS